MGKIKQGILGGFSGKVGNVIGTSWKGISVVKVMPQSVANPKTTAQVNQRNALSWVVQLATMILASVIKPCWDRFAQGMSGYNDFVSTNISLFTGQMPQFPEQIVMCKGKLEPLGSVDLTLTSNTSASVSTTPGSLGVYGASTDKVYLVLLNSLTGDAMGMELTGDRSTLTARVIDTTALNIISTAVVYAYAFCRREDGTMVSNQVVTSEVRA